MSRVVCPWDLITSFVIDAFKGYGVPVDGMFGTNPLTIGIPTDEDFDFILDCATSITQNGKIEYYIRTGEPVHQGTVRSIYENRRLKKELYKASKQA